jgi:hypothetical protein
LEAITNFAAVLEFLHSCRVGVKDFEFQVKWTGYALTTFEPAENPQDNSALDEWEMFTAPYRNQQSKLLPAEFRRGDEGQFSRRKPPCKKQERGGNVRC